MNDLEINIGLIENDVVALCEDLDYKYAFYAEKGKDKFRARMASTSGIVTSTDHKLTVDHRSMVMIALMAHMEALDNLAEQHSETPQPNPRVLQ